MKSIIGAGKKGKTCTPRHIPNSEKMTVNQLQSTYLSIAHDVQRADRIFCNSTQCARGGQISIDRFGCHRVDVDRLRISAALGCDTLVIWDEVY